MCAFLSKLAQLRSLTPLSARATRDMDALYGLDATTNAEIKAEWLKVGVRRGDGAFKACVCEGGPPHV